MPKPLYSDGRDKARKGISKGEAAFLQESWELSRIGNPTLHYDHFDFELYAIHGSPVWTGTVTRKGWADSETLDASEDRRSPVDAKLALYDKMKRIKARRKIYLEAEKRSSSVTRKTRV